MSFFPFLPATILYVYMGALEKISGRKENALQSLYWENVFAGNKVLRLALHSKRGDMGGFHGIW